jgi:hypothetical protein
MEIYMIRWLNPYLMVLSELKKLSLPSLISQKSLWFGFPKTNSSTVDKIFGSTS